MPKWNAIEGSLASPEGFRASAVHAGFKKDPHALDLALIYSEAEMTAAAAVFTTNRAAAAPVELSRRHLARSRGLARAVVVNSGNANACTGPAGMAVAKETARRAAELLGVPPTQVLVASTGVIGAPVNPSIITRRLPGLCAALAGDDAEDAARAIMTTDTFPKSCVLAAKFGGRRVCIAGIAKGAGMIHPRMATMLSFITTDAGLDPHLLGVLLRAAVDASFNRVTVDGDTSTNDTVIALAGGLSGVWLHPASREAALFQAGLAELSGALARMIAKDGEGARKLVTVEVRGARSRQDADLAARAIANSPLVKTAIAGGDPNWGRILCAAGYSGARFNPEKTEIRVNGLPLCRSGVDAGFSEAAAKKQLGKKEITLTVDFHSGKASAHMWTCDLTEGYIRINGSYRS
ncbi:MAG: bifunctional glutamate N-acetyltransferase/amino-acid acetyltransferase ArgJ [Acidobacteriota bacterium]|nr:bifunctional glutamate N-acetyltransferase/amino-acid acetyltransferase ArgJ [Acidobacteriota bacterium]